MCVKKIIPYSVLTLFLVTGQQTSDANPWLLLYHACQYPLPRKRNPIVLLRFLSKIGLFSRFIFQTLRLSPHPDWIDNTKTVLKLVINAENRKPILQLPMKPIRAIMLVALTIGLMFQTSNSFGQCQLNYKLSETSATVSGNDGRIKITFESVSDIPNCLLFNNSNGTPYLLIDAQKNVDKAQKTITFYGLSPAVYLVRMNRKGCKAQFIGWQDEIKIGKTSNRL